MTRPSRGGRVFDVVYEDDALVVVDKHAGFLTVPTARREPNTVVGALSRYLGRGASRGRRVEIVHRLDRDTSGLLVFAKTPAVAAELIQQFKDHKPLREYLAIVAGSLAKPKGTFRSRLATDRALNQRSVRDDDGDGDARPAVTHFEVERSLGTATLVRVTLETGRRNQIRVHFAEDGHPVLGDTRYAARQAAHPRWPWRRLALHAARLGFAHPVTGEPLEFESRPPLEFGQFVRAEAKGR